MPGPYRAIDRPAFRFAVAAIVSVADLAVPPPVAPMLARAQKDIPEGDYFYEPKYDGFRCIVFRHGDDFYLGSRNERPFTRYFPELLEVLGASLPERAVVDGEIFVADGAVLDFELLGQRIHPADSRVKMLAEKTPASFVAFDLLCAADEDFRPQPFHRRRQGLEELLTPSHYASPGAALVHPGVYLTPATRDVAVARQWFHDFEGAGLDGIVAKAADLAYVADKRLMVKVKHERTADFVVAGFRWFKTSTPADPKVGSLMLGLYDTAGGLSHVGVIGSFPEAKRRQLVGELAPFRLGPQGDADHPWAAWASAMGEPGQPRLPGGQSRWNATKDLSFVPLRPELVVEASFEHLQGDRLRHMAQFRRWRPDREARSCTYQQLDVAGPYELAQVLHAGATGAPGGGHGG